MLYGCKLALFGSFQSEPTRRPVISLGVHKEQFSIPAERTIWDIFGRLTMDLTGFIKNCALGCFNSTGKYNRYVCLGGYLDLNASSDFFLSKSSFIQRYF